MDECSTGVWHRVRGVLVAAGVVIALAACGGSDDAPPPAPPPAVGSATLGAAGGTVTGPDGVQLVVPPGALEAPVTLRIARSSAGAPALPPEYGTNLAIYEITPHNQRFLLPVEVRLPVATAEPVIAALVASPGGDWGTVETPVRNGMAVFERSELSWFASGGLGNVFLACSGPCNLVVSVMSGRATVTPATAEVVQGSSRRLVAPATINAAIDVLVPSSCAGPVLTVVRERWGGAASPNAGRVVSSQLLSSGVAVSPVPGSATALRGSTTFSDTVEGSLYTNLRYGLALRCTINGQPRTAYASFGYLTQIAPPAAPVITQQPVDAGVTEGQAATFTVAATVTPAAPLTYQWFRRADTNASFAPIAGAGSTDYTLPSAALADSGAQFRVEVCAGASRCTTSEIATLSVARAASAPAFLVVPVDITVVAGQTVSFSAAANGFPLPTIAWQSAPANDPANFSAVTGATACVTANPPASGTATTATCTVGPLATADSGRRYRAVATNSVASATSGVATLTVTPAPAAPVITQQPAAGTTTEGGSASFTVAATGTAPLAYAWRLNGTALPAANGAFTIGTCTGQVAYTNGGATATLSNLARACDGAAVSVVVSNGIAPNATSNTATLTVNAPSATLSLLAGAIGGPGWVDGPGDVARVAIGTTHGIAFAANGTAYFTDASNRLRRMSPTGEVTTISNGLLAPSGVAVDAAGNIYVAERFGHRITRFTPAGASAVYVGGTQGDVDGTGAAARLSTPQALAIDAAGNLYFTQEGGDGTRKLRRVSTTLEVSTLFTFAAGLGAVAIAVEPDGSAVYGTGLGGLSNSVIRIAGGSLSVLAGAPGQSGDVDGSGSAARFFGAQGITRVAAGDLYVADLSAYSIRRVTPAGAVTRVSGSAASPVVPVDGVGSAGRYESPAAIGAAPDGSLLVGDTSTLRRLTVPGFALTTVAGKRLEGGTADGTGSAARFQGPFGLALGSDGTAYVADIDRIRRVSPAGVVSTLALVPAQSIARAPDGTLVAASENAVWRVTPSGASTLIAGQQGDRGYVDGGTDVARFNSIGDVAVDAGGNIFVTEVQLHTIRRIGADGVVSTWAGAQGASGSVDGARSAARFNFPYGLAIDGAGALYIADTSNHTVRRISGDVVTTVAGSAPLAGSVDGVGSAARLFAPLRLAFDTSGNLLIADTGNRTVRRMTPSFAVTTLLGNPGVPGVRLGNQPQLNFVLGLAVRGDGRLVLTSEGAVLEATLP